MKEVYFNKLQKQYIFQMFDHQVQKHYILVGKLGNLEGWVSQITEKINNTIFENI